MCRYKQVVWHGWDLLQGANCWDNVLEDCVGAVGSSDAGLGPFSVWRLSAPWVCLTLVWARSQSGDCIGAVGVSDAGMGPFSVWRLSVRWVCLTLVWVRSQSGDCIGAVGSSDAGMGPFPGCRLTLRRCST